jgi:hypothetical protein
MGDGVFSGSVSDRAWKGEAQLGYRITMFEDLSIYLIESTIDHMILK